MAEKKQELKSKKEITKERKILTECFSNFSSKFSYAFDNQKNKYVNWYYWGEVQGKKCKLYIVSKSKCYIFPDRIISDENYSHNEKKLSPFKGKFGYFVLVISAVPNIKDSLSSYSFTVKKAYRKARKRAAINYAYRLWWTKVHPDEEHVPFYANEKREVSEEKREQMQERGKKLFQILSDKNKIICPRCECAFSNFGKGISTHCPECKTKFIINKKTVDTAKF